jgi:ATP-dependent RNA helicase DeaD
VQATVAATAADSITFRDLGLHEGVLQALLDVGYEAPTPIQAATIPTLLGGSDVLGQAQTGTGKTGAFALPMLSKIDLSKPQTQALVLVPTRELAIQVAEAFQRYATHMKGFHVLPIYGGQSYTPQLKGLKRGAHVIVGTPGRVMDHMKRGTMPLDAMNFLVLDEADEMLQMGFIDAIEWILEQSPPKRQIALFSATMPSTIRRIAQKHLRSPKEITIRSKTSTAPNIRQRYWVVSGMHKLDALTRILEAESFEAMLVFVRTKLETVELAERLEARGFEAAPLNGDIPQAQRERTIAALKSGKVDIVVATDVAARGLDVERISHVVNFDVPYDSESYVHRIGRTGRAGRSGEAILFIAPRERNMLRIIERATRQPLTQMNLPSISVVNQQRVARFKQKIADTLSAGETAEFRAIVEEFQAENDVPAIEIAAALASLLQGPSPLLLPEKADSGDGWGRRSEGRDGSRDRGARGGRDGDRGDGRRGAGANDRGGGDGYRGGGANDRGGGDGYRGGGANDRGSADGFKNAGANVRGGSDGFKGGGANDRGGADAIKGPRANDRSAGNEHRGARPNDSGAGDERRAPWPSDRSAGSEHRGARPSDAGDQHSVAPSRDSDGGSEHVRDRGDDAGRDGGVSHATAHGLESSGQRDVEHNSRVQGEVQGNQVIARHEFDHTQRFEGEGQRGDGFTQRGDAHEVRADHGAHVEKGSDGEGASAAAHQHGNGNEGAGTRQRANDSDFVVGTDQRGNGNGNGNDGGSGGQQLANGNDGASGSHQRSGNGAERLGARAARRKKAAQASEEVVFETFRLEVGHAHGVKPGNIVGAIANEAGLEGKHIGQVDIRDDHSFVDLPEGMPRDIFRNLKKVRVVGQELKISRVEGKPQRQH